MTLDTKAFTAFEQAAHDRIARPYAEHFAPLTTLALEPLLDAAQVKAGQRVLDVATGPGVAAAVAHRRGAGVVGVDVSPGMVTLARDTHPDVDFRVAEVTVLPFSDDTFNAVLCNFGLGHFPEPEAALAECVRVLAPGGRLAFSWWDQPVRQRVQGLFREAITELRLVPPPEVPQGHDTLRFSDPGAFAELLRGAGLVAVQVTVSCTRFLWTPICPRRDRNDDARHEAD
jgi:SAM-dependent methyltransferase